MINRKEFEKWKIDSDVRQYHIAKELGVTEIYVSMVINGKRKSQKVIDAFIRRGCPKEIFEAEP